MEIYNAKTSINVLATTKLAARKAAAALIPTLIQLVSSQPVQDSLTQQNKKFDYAEMIEEALDLAGWDAGNLIVDMTPEDAQRAQQMNASAAKAQGDLQKQQLANQGALQTAEETATGKAGLAIVKHILDSSKAENQLGPQLQQLEASANPPAPAMQ